MTVMTGAFAVGDISGGAFNPAVAVGISILGISGWGNLWIYLLADFAAAVVAAFVFNLINPPTQTTPIATDEPPYETPRQPRCGRRGIIQADNVAAPSTRLFAPAA